MATLPLPPARRFLQRTGRLAKAAGLKTVYTALLLYYAYERKEIPKWAKKSILGALGYLLMPLDAVPDLTPILGYTDDLAVLGAGLAVVAAYVDGGVRRRARTTLARWFPSPDTATLDTVDEQLDA